MAKCFNHGMWGQLFLCPAYCFIIALTRIRKGNIKAAWVIPFIMGFFAYLFPPFADFARAYDQVIQLKDLPLSQVIILRGDIVVTTFEYLFLKLNLPIEIFRFIYTFTAYYYITKIFIDVAQSKKFKLNNKQKYLIWIFLFMQIDFFAYIDNIRTIFVRIMIVYCAYQYYFNNSDKHRYYSLILVIVHYAYFPIIGLFFISKYFNLRLTRKRKLLFLYFFFFSSSFSQFIDLSSLFSLINFGDTINSRIISYTEGEWSADGDSLNSMSKLYHIYVFLLSISSYYNIYLFYKSKKIFKINTFLIMLLCLCVPFSMIPVMYGRYIGFLHIFIAFYIFQSYLYKGISKRHFKICLLLYGFNTILNIYSNWNCLVNGNIIFLLFPIPILLFQTYNFSNWCKLHLADDFNKIINGNFLSR